MPAEDGVMVIRLTLAFPPAATKLLVGIYVTPAEVLLLRALLGSQARIRAPGDARGPGFAKDGA